MEEADLGRALLAAFAAVPDRRDRHGDRHEVRCLWVSEALCGYLAWPDAQQVAKGERTSTHRGKMTVQTRYVLTSLPEPGPLWDAPGHQTVTAADLLRLVRGHWSVENRLHCIWDVTFGEDLSQVRKGATPQVLAALRNVVIGLLRGAGWANIAAALHYNAWRPDAALELLGLIS